MLHFRKKIVKFFALDYVVFMFGRQISWTRSANVIFPLMLLSGMFSLNPFQRSTFEVVTYILYGLLIVSLFFGFVYFRIKPLRQADYDYFDAVQKYIWNYHNGKQTMIEKYTPKWVFWLNPLLFVLTLFYCLLIF